MSLLAFLLTLQEKEEVVTECDHLLRPRFSPVLPRAPGSIPPYTSDSRIGAGTARPGLT